jgi:hypothetical protein
MSVGCTWHLLIPVGRLEGQRLLRVVEALDARGLSPLRDPGGIIWGMNADGSGTSAFDEVSSAASWIGKEGGLVSFVGPKETDELSLSVHKVNGMLPVELGPFGDSPIFDEVQLDIAELAARSHGAAWRVFDKDALAIAELCGAVFAWCLDELSLEVLGLFSTHRSIAAGELPVLRGAVLAVPHQSALLPPLRAMSEDLGGTLSDHYGWTELRRTPCLWPALGVDPLPEEGPSG